MALEGFGISKPYDQEAEKSVARRYRRISALSVGILVVSGAVSLAVGEKLDAVSEAEEARLAADKILFDIGNSPLDHQENFLSSTMAEFTYGLTTEVQCADLAEYDKLNPLNGGGWRIGMHVPEDLGINNDESLVIFDEFVCNGLASENPWEAAASVLVFSHEGAHAIHGSDEAVANCGAAYDYFRAADLLGLSDLVSWVDPLELARSNPGKEYEEYHRLGC